MSTIDELIARYCPNGVEYVKLGELCDIKTGKGIVQQDCSEGGVYPVVSGGMGYMGYYKYCNRDANTATISRVGANAGFVNYIQEDFYLNDKCFSAVPLRANLNSKYLYNILKSKELCIKKLQSEGGVPTINTKKLINIEIPIPPLEVQEEIVRILDNMENLTLKLQEELDERKRQFEYYRENVLKKIGSTGFRYYNLKDVCVFIVDGTHASLKNVEEGFPLLSAKDVYERKVHIPIDCRQISKNDFESIYKKYKLQVNDVLLTIVGTIGRVALIDKDSINVAFQRSVAIMRADVTKINSKYLLYIFELSDIKKQLKQNVNQSAQGGIYLGRLNSLQIPVPSLSEQQRIVSILDNMVLLQDKLQAEIDERKRQFEYYREKLLNFERI